MKIMKRKINTVFVEPIYDQFVQNCFESKNAISPCLIFCMYLGCVNPLLDVALLMIIPHFSIHCYSRPCCADI